MDDRETLDWGGGYGILHGWGWGNEDWGCKECKCGGHIHHLGSSRIRPYMDLIKLGLMPSGNIQ